MKKKITSGKRGESGDWSGNDTLNMYQYRFFCLALLGELRKLPKTQNRLRESTAVYSSFHHRFPWLRVK